MTSVEEMLCAECALTDEVPTDTILGCPVFEDLSSAVWCTSDCAVVSGAMRLTGAGRNKMAVKTVSEWDKLPGSITACFGIE